MKVKISSVFAPNDKVFGFVLHDETELPFVPLIRLADMDLRQLEALRDNINEALEWR